MREAAEHGVNRFEQAVLDKVQRILDENIRKYGGKLNAVRFTTDSNGEFICYPCNCNTYDCIGQFSLNSQELKALQYLAPDLTYTSTLDLIEEVIEKEGVVEIVYYAADENLIGTGLRTETGSLGIFMISEREFSDLRAEYGERVSFRKPEEDGPNRSSYEPVVEVRAAPEPEPEEPASEEKKVKPPKKSNVKKVKSAIKTPVRNVLSQEESHELTGIGFSAAEVKRMQLVLRSVARVLMAKHELSEGEALEVLRLNIGDAADTILKLGKE